MDISFRTSGLRLCRFNDKYSYMLIVYLPCQIYASRLFSVRYSRSYICTSIHNFPYMYIHTYMCTYLHTDLYILCPHLLVFPNYYQTSFTYLINQHLTIFAAYMYNICLFKDQMFFDIREYAPQ